MNLPRVDTLLINANRTNGKQLRTGEEAVEYLKPYFENAKTPSIHLVQLNVQCKILRSNTITVKAFENHHREILSDLLLNNAQQVIVCDNYKNIAKSQKLSNKIKEYLKYPQIRLIDYINLPQKIHFNDMNYDEDIYYSNNDEINLNSKYIEKNIKLVEEGYLDVKSGSLSDTLDSLYEDLRKRTREEVVTLNIDEDLKPINYIVSSIGTIDRSLASSFELLKGSIMSGARNVILLHNHPSGSNYPSKGDIEMTRKVQEAYNFMGINFYDHHIVGSKVYSFKENGLLDEMRDKQSVKFEKDIKIKKNKEKGAEKKMEILNSKFNDLQLEQIRLGLEEDLDISKYADPKFSSHQMDEIQYGLSEELDISKYADPKFDWAQMREIRQGLEKDLDISHYADPKFDWEQMWEIRQGLEKGLDISQYADPKFDHLQMSQIRYGLEEDLDVSKYADPKFDSWQMEQIQHGLEEDLDVSKYANPKFDYLQMSQIRQGLEAEVDISQYADPKFDWEQMWEIRQGLEEGLDVSKYADPKFNREQMREIRQGLEKGLDISQYADPKFNYRQMWEIRLGLKAGVDVSQYADPKFDGEQMQEIRRGLMDDIDVSKYADPKFNAAQMYEIRGGLTDGLDVSKYADPKFDNLQMSQIRRGLMDDIDVSKYADPKFNWEQMEQIIQGLKCGLDVSKYADPKFDWEQMQEIRLDSANVNIQKADINVGETVKTHEGEKYVIGKNNEKYVLFDANDKEKKYQVVENIFYDKVTQEYSWEFGETIDSLQMATNLIYNSYDDIKRSISFYCGSKHKEYFKSVMSIENSIEDENLLDDIYHEYMNNDSMQLINPDLKDLKDDASKKYDNEEETYYKHELDYERE